MSRALLVGLGFALVLSNALWLYASVDRSVTLDHQSSELARQRERAELLTRLMVDYPRETDAGGAYAVLRAQSPIPSSSCAATRWSSPK